MLRSVYHGEHGVRTLKEQARSYLTISKDLGRVMSRVKAIYRTQATGHELIEIFPESDYDFFDKLGDAQITFVTDSQGHATELILHRGEVYHAPRVQQTP
jgi:hypothetical protein